MSRKTITTDDLRDEWAKFYGTPQVIIPDGIGKTVAEMATESGYCMSSMFKKVKVAVSSGKMKRIGARMTKGRPDVFEIVKGKRR